MKNKEILESMVFNSFMNDKISYKKYNQMLEFIEAMPEKKVNKILKEQGTNLTAKRKAVHSVVGAVGSIVGSGGAGYVGYRLLKGLFSKCARSCGMLGLNTVKRQLCLAKCKLMVAQKSGDQGKIQAAQKKFQALQQYGASKGKEAPQNINPNQTNMFTPE